MTEVHASHRDTYHFTYLKITKWTEISSDVKIYMHIHIFIHITPLLIGISTYGITFPLTIKDAGITEDRRNKTRGHVDRFHGHEDFV